MSHTPGPWVHQTYYNEHYVTDNLYEGICEFYFTSGGHGFSEERKAYANAADNARLIAAAPDLLKVLQVLVQQRDAYFHQATDAWQEARAAIEKATKS